VRLHGLTLGSPGASSPPPAADAGGRGTETLLQPANTGLEFAIRVPEAAELAFTPRVRGNASSPVVFRVALTREGHPARDLLSVELSAGERSAPVRLPVPGEVGAEALLGLHVDARGEEATGEWLEPVVLGRAVPQTPAEAPETLDGAAALRPDLEGKSVLLLVLDAAAAKHFGCYGYGRDTTPHIDRLAAEGFLFERAYTPTPYTRLAMASLWTSQYPDQHHHGVRPRAQLPAHRVVLPELLERRGIPARAVIGNLVAGEPSGLTRGFAEMHHVFREEGASPKAEPVRRHVETWLAGRSAGRGLFYAHFLEPHFPYDPPPPFDTRFGDGPIPRRLRGERSWFEGVKVGRTPMGEGPHDHVVRLYDANLAYADHQIGLLRERLEKEGRWDDLIVVLTADHGEEFLEHGSFEHGWHLYDEIIKIPLIIRLPRQAEPRRLPEPVDLIDLGATLADIFGVLGDAAGQFEGRSLLPLLAGGRIVPRTIYARDLTQRPSYATFDGHLKLIHNPNWGVTELYEPERDPGERRDLASERPVMAELRRQELYRWLRDLDRGTPGVETETPLDRETEEALRALGYVN
jgi:arylsulfatase A-like enzyme